MRNFKTTKMDSVFDEIYALLVIENLYPGSVDNIYKWESPDWKNNDNSLGIEVTRAQNNHIGYTYNVMTKYLGASKNQIPVSLLHKFRGETFLPTENCWLFLIAKDLLAETAMSIFYWNIWKLN